MEVAELIDLNQVIIALSHSAKSIYNEYIIEQVHDRMYKFNVEVREPFKWRGCYDAVRIESKPVSVLIGLAGKDTLPELNTGLDTYIMCIY